MPHPWHFKYALPVPLVEHSTALRKHCRKGACREFLYADWLLVTLCFTGVLSVCTIILNVEIRCGTQLWVKNRWFTILLYLALVQCVIKFNYHALWFAPPQLNIWGGTWPLAPPAPKPLICNNVSLRARMRTKSRQVSRLECMCTYWPAQRPRQWFLP